MLLKIYYIQGSGRNKMVGHLTTMKNRDNMKAVSCHSAMEINTDMYELGMEHLDPMVQ